MSRDSLINFTVEENTTRKYCFDTLKVYLKQQKVNVKYDEKCDDKTKDEIIKELESETKVDFKSSLSKKIIKLKYPKVFISLKGKVLKNISTSFFLACQLISMKWLNICIV